MLPCIARRFVPRFVFCLMLSIGISSLYTVSYPSFTHAYAHASDGSTVSTSSYADATASSYTEEAAKSSNFIDLINAQVAYSQGYTGAGIMVGVFDEAVLTTHSELLGKAWSTDTFDDGVLYVPNWDYDTHGSHVSGIIAASLNGEGMYGVAYDASIMGAAFLGHDVYGNAYSFEPDAETLNSAFAGVRIINNSWNAYWLPYLDGDIAAVFTYMTEYPNDTISWIGNYGLANKDTVIVFSAGNDGLSTPTMPASFPYALGSGLNNWISVGSLDSAWIDIDGDGSLVFADGGISIFSNLAAGAERYTVFAPGSSIYSLDASTGDYATHSGTSMAAPVVSGALALVLQKFPWLTGSQLASTILSTANSNMSIPDGYFFQLSTGYDDDAEDFYYYCTFNYDADVFGALSASSATDLAQIKALIKESIAKNPTAWSYLGLTEDNIDTFDMSSLTLVLSTYDSDDLESIIGQGVLDVGAAMGGIAELDANRMTAAYVQEIEELDEAKHAIEVFDTKGYTAVFSNDISGFAWDDKYHYEDYQTGGDDSADADALNADTGGVGSLIGIEKAGDGALVLTGNNTYEGATLVTGGILGLMQVTDADSGTAVDGSGTLTTSDVVVRSGGTFVGDGIVASSLINNGIVSPGAWLLSWYSSSYGSSGTNTLTVADYSQGADGALHIYFDSSGAYGQLAITSSASLAGTLSFVPCTDFYTDTSSYILSNVVTGAGATTSATDFSSIAVAQISPTLSFTMNQTGASTDYSYTLTMHRESSAYSQYAYDASSQSLSAVLYGISTDQGIMLDTQNLFAALDFSNVNGSEVQTAFGVLSPDSFSTVTEVALSQQTAFNATVMNQMLSSASMSKVSLITEKGKAGEGLADMLESDNLLASNGLAVSDAYGLPSSLFSNANTENLWEFWASAVGSYAKQGSSSLASAPWTSSSLGLMVGIDKLVTRASEAGSAGDLRLGFHVIGTTSQTNYISANTDSSAFFVGAHGHYAFSDSKANCNAMLDGVYISGLVRAGWTHNDMLRGININGYTAYNTSDWLDTSLTTMLAVGKDWRHDDYCFGPFLRLDGNYMRRPDITESGSSTRLHIEGDDYFTLPLSLGGHVGLAMETFQGQKLYLDVLLAWQHQILDDSFESHASFADYANSGFTTTSESRGRDSLSLEASMHCGLSESLSLQFNAGATMYSSRDYDVSGGLSVIWGF